MRIHPEDISNCPITSERLVASLTGVTYTANFCPEKFFIWPQRAVAVRDGAFEVPQVVPVLHGHQHLLHAR